MGVMGMNARNWRILETNGWVGEQSHPEAPRPLPQNYKVGQKLSYLFINSTRLGDHIEPYLLSTEHLRYPP